ncbi:CotH kinase family protein [Marinobacter sp. CHS3-4]|uniref:CotH kinase family protein n=1 Tax=Marinobacter sp. CHS3-4 TaxID=3045174 RepID=UPI0024B58F50|nr:CotH kinase family protein [Marinobacter sp. CHS3-4]MDI9244336.1 CotH kinase family protein [Marinobacter sp. CHS3-4]
MTFRMFFGRIQAFIGFLLISFLAGCGGGGGTTESSGSDFDAPVEPVNIGGDGDFYDSERLVDVAITLSSSNYRKLKSEARTLAGVSRECIPGFEYTEFPATVTIDGDTMRNVNVRKKGYMGSLSPDLPSLKLDFDDRQEGRTYQNTTRMTLNNNRQDPSNLRQCLAYERFRDIGVAAPRCNYARVSVNGEELGIFTNVEPIKKPFLARTFGDDDGNLYEAQQADFGTYLIDRFEKKTNEKEDDRTDLAALADAMALNDTELMNVLPQLIDLDEFIEFWAMETLLGAWDSASGNANNYYIYRSPEDGLFHFIPWGADTAFRGTHPLKPGTGPLYRNLNLAERLYNIPAMKDAYTAALQDLLANHWDESAITDEIDRVMALTGTPAADVASLENFLLGKGEPADPDYQRSQRETILAALAGSIPEGQPDPLDDVEPDCSAPVTTPLTATVSVDGGTDTGVYQFQLPGGQSVNASMTFAAFEVDSIVINRNTESSPAVMEVLLIGADSLNGFKPYAMQVFIEETDFVPGTHKLHGFATNVLLFEVDESQPGDVISMATGATGTITVDTVVMDGGAVSELAFSMDLTLEYLPGYVE